MGPDDRWDLMSDRFVIRVVLDVGRGPRPSGTQCRARPDVGRWPSMCLFMYGVWYFGNSLIFRLSIFGLCFRYLRIERDEPGMIVEHIPPHFEITLICFGCTDTL